MPTLLVVHHTCSPTLQELLEAVLAGARDPEIEGVDVVVRPALSASAAEVLAAEVRDPAVTVVAPHALCLEEVAYPPAADLAARAQATRRLRPAPQPP